MESNFKGLTASEVGQSRDKYGENMITPPKRESVWKLFLEKFNDPVIRILIIAAVLSFVISFIHQDFTETIGIVLAVLLATGVGFWFEYDAGRKFDVLNAISDEALVRVIRDGAVTEVAKREIVVGDTVLLEAGEEIPADGKLVDALLMRVNESTLTGEPSVSKTINESEFKKEATYASNMVLRGTTVIEGNGIMQVAAIGDSTEFGKVASAATAKTTEKTPLTKQLDWLAKIIGVVGFTLAFLLFNVMLFRDLFFGGESYPFGQLELLFISLAAVFILMAKIWLPIVKDGIEIIRQKEVRFITDRRGWGFWLLMAAAFVILAYGVIYLIGVDPLDRTSWIDGLVLQGILGYFMIAVTLIVVAVPEGLPMSVTLSLALNMRRMLKSNNLVRKMHACETMGAINIICTDKTGTLTQNQMRVYEPNFFALKGGLDASQLSNVIIESIAMNSTAHLDNSGEKIKTIGNPTEAALLLWLADNGVNYVDLRSKTEIVDRIVFSTERKYMSTLVDSQVLTGKRLLYIKGAPEVILAKSKVVLTDGGDVLAKELTPKIMEQLLAYQNKAMRTLGFAYAVVSNEATACSEEMERAEFIFLGITAISDPVRADVPEAVRECLDAGIAVKIVTGDTPGTAKEIARQIGLWNDVIDTDFNHITGAEFEALSDEVLLERVLDLKIMSRARPSDKQRLVQLLQQKGGVVAVTGDGTNDAPALNYAHVGLSMGTGTSVAKEASDITLLDDSFKSIATAVMWGRSLYKNIQRFILFQLTINVVAILIVFIGALFGSESPLTITQMLWVNLIMDTFAAAALASLPPNKGVMKDKPRGVRDFIITRKMATSIISSGLLFVVILSIALHMLNQMFLPDYALSIFFTVFVMIQFWNMYNAKAFDSKSSSAFKDMKYSLGFIVISLLILIGQVLIVDYGGQMFRTVPISLEHWLWIVGGTSVILIFGEIYRFFKRLKVAS